jgi:hypothetical protein
VQALAGDQSMRESANPVAIVPRYARTLRCEGDHSVKGARVDEDEAERVREPTGDRAFAGSGGAVDGHDGGAAGGRHAGGHSMRGRCRIEDEHPRVRP